MARRRFRVSARRLKQAIKRRHPAWFEIHPFGEVLPYAHNRITVDASRVDRYGVPLPRIDYRIGENERKMTEHMADTVEEIVKASGGVLVNYKRGQLDAMGSAIHEHGTCRMGADPEAVGAERLQPDARGEERVRGGRVGVPECVREESDADDPGALVARDRSSGRGDQTWQPLTADIGRRQAIRALASGAVAAVASASWVESLTALARQQAHTHAAVAVIAAQNWAPRTLTPHQNDLVVALTELIIPQTDTPGAKAASVNRFIDQVLTDAQPAVRESFVRGLTWIDTRSRALSGERFPGRVPRAADDAADTPVGGGQFEPGRGDRPRVLSGDQVDDDQRVLHERDRASPGARR